METGGGIGGETRKSKIESSMNKYYFYDFLKYWVAM